MVVDDDCDTLEMFAHVLHTNGATVITATSALRALAILRDVVPSIIVVKISSCQSSTDSHSSRRRGRSRACLIFRSWR
jgi:DNA-binding response OmpR family regulator